MKMELYYKKIGENIRSYRRISNMSQGLLAEKVNKSIATISKYERGLIAIDIYTMVEIAEALEVSFDLLLPETSSEKSHNINNNVIPFFQSKRHYIYWYNGEYKRIECAILELNHETFAATVYMGIDRMTNEKKDAGFIFNGSFNATDLHTRITVENTKFPGDFSLFHFNNMNILMGKYIGLISGVKATTQSVAIKCYISIEPIKNRNSIMDYIKISKEDLAVLKATNYLTV